MLHIGLNRSMWFWTWENRQCTRFVSFVLGSLVCFSWFSMRNRNLFDECSSFFYDFSLFYRFLICYFFSPLFCKQIGLRRQDAARDRMKEFGFDKRVINESIKQVLKVFNFPFVEIFFFEIWSHTLNSIWISGVWWGPMVSDWRC